MTRIPKFANDQEESEFWATHDATEFLDEIEPVDATFVDARPEPARISLPLDPEVIDNVKAIARDRGVDYKTLIGAWVKERLEKELS